MVEYTFKDIKTAYLVVSVLSKNNEIPEQLRATLKQTASELLECFERMRKENVPSDSSTNKNKTTS